MKLSELIAASPAPERAFGVEVDAESYDPPAGLKEISLVARTDADGFAEDVLDVAIAYRLAGVDVILEIPSEQPIADTAYMMSVIANMNSHVALLPPVDASEESFERYVERVEAFVPHYARQRNFGRMLMPLTSYLEYLFVEAADPEKAKGFTPTDDFVLSRFHEPTSTERADRLKDRLRRAFESVYGGAEDFLAFRKAVMAGIFKDFERQLAEIAPAQA